MQPIPSLDEIHDRKMASGRLYTSEGQGHVHLDGNEMVAI